MKFLIIITCYNREKFILRCIKSALNQAGVDRSAYEVIVVNDCSTDKSQEIISQFKNLIRIIKIVLKKILKKILAYIFIEKEKKFIILKI